MLLRRRAGAAVAEAVAPGSPWLGVMLPYTPLHHLLAADFGGPLVLTSGNLSDEPIAFDDDEARGAARRDRRRLPRARPADPPPLRGLRRARRRSRSAARAGTRRPRCRSRAPRRTIVAAGAELKSTFCVTRGGEAFLSPHLGDLDSEPAYRAFRTDLALYLAMLDVELDVVAHDLHPEYLSTKWALEQDAELVGVQHHHAHAAACLAEHGEEGPALALVFDGTGYGTDGTLWGGELLRCDLESFERVAHLDPVPLPGGEAAIREPWRVAALHLERAGLPVPWPEWELVRESLKLAPPLSSGMGRLFDAVAAVLGVRERVSYEGQAAVELEQLAGTARGRAVPVAVRRRHGARRDLPLGARVRPSRGGDRRALPRDRRRRRGGRVRGGGRAAPGRALRRQLPEPPAARLDARPARGARLPRPRATAACRRTTGA